MLASVTGLAVGQGLSGLFGLARLAGRLRLCGSLGVRIGDIPAGVSGILHHAVDYNSGLSAIHRNFTAERAVRVAGNYAQSVHIGDRIPVLAGNIIVVRDFGNSRRLVRAACREALTGHNIGDELGHVVPGDTAAHFLNIIRVVRKAGVVQRLVRHHGLIVGPEGSAGDIYGVFVLFDISREKRADSMTVKLDRLTVLAGRNVLS